MKSKENKRVSRSISLAKWLDDKVVIQARNYGIPVSELIQKYLMKEFKQDGVK